ncbi:MAG: hypothetical protein KatS3mg105_0808 [Gemmatales bacterium]|nr:MAG: hypothetical protein KatS3mg105_0808 [Gemmatales bacterium]
MDNTNVLVTAMAEKCRELIRDWSGPPIDLPEPLEPEHLIWMCEIIEKNADEWPATKLHRWIGFVQCAMIANRMLDLSDAKAMFNNAKIAHSESSEDELDHLDPANVFELDIGGEG